MTTEMARERSEGMAGRPMVLHVRVVTATGGGPEKTILNSPRFLQRLGYRSLVAFMHPPGDPGFEEIRRRGREAGIDVISIPDRGAWDWRPLLALISLCRRENVAIWHGHDYKSNVFGLLVRRFHRMRLVTTAHGWVDKSGRMPIYDRVDLAVLPFYERVICVSDDLVGQCQAAGISPSRICHIENAIDAEQYDRQVERCQAKKRLEMPASTLLIGAVGRLSPEKGFDVLIQAIVRLRGKGHDIGLVIAGEGPDRARLEQTIAVEALASHCRLLGHVSRIRDVYEAIDIFALSSLREGLPNVVLEAMAMSLPIVATRVAGVPRIIEHDQTGLLVAPGDADEIANGLEILINNCKVRQELGRQGRRLIEERYSFRQRMEKVTGVYQSLGVLSSADAASSSNVRESVRAETM